MCAVIWRQRYCRGLLIWATTASTLYEALCASAVSSQIVPRISFQSIGEPFALDIKSPLKLGLIYYLTAKWSTVIISCVPALIG